MIATKLAGIAVKGLIGEAKQQPWTTGIVTLMFLFLVVTVPWGWLNLARAADVQQIAAQLNGIERRSLESEICNLDKARSKAADRHVRSVIAQRYKDAQNDYHALTDDYFPIELCVE